MPSKYLIMDSNIDLFFSCLVCHLFFLAPPLNLWLSHEKVWCSAPPYVSCSLKEPESHCCISVILLVGHDQRSAWSWFEEERVERTKTSADSRSVLFSYVTLSSSWWNQLLSSHLNWFADRFGPLTIMEEKCFNLIPLKEVIIFTSSFTADCSTGPRRKRTGLLAPGPRSCFLLKVKCAFYLGIKVQGFGGRLVRSRTRAVKSPKSVMIWVAMSSVTWLLQRLLKYHFEKTFWFWCAYNFCHNSPFFCCCKNWEVNSDISTVFKFSGVFFVLFYELEPQFM